MACALVSPCGRVELLRDASLDVKDILQEPIHALTVRGFTLFFSSASFFSSEVNEFASGLAKQLIKGDACLVHDHQQQLVEYLQQSKQLRMAQCEAPCTSSSSSTSHAVLVSCVESPANSTPKSNDACSCCDSSCQLKRPRSLQHIAAANSTRQRILRSMSATGTSPPLPIDQDRAASRVMSVHRTSSYSTSNDGDTICCSWPAGARCLPPSSSRRRMPAAAAAATEGKGGVSSGPDSGVSTVPFFDFYSCRSGSSMQECTSTQQGTLPQCRDGMADEAKAGSCEAVAATAMDIDASQQQDQEQQDQEQQPAAEQAGTPALGAAAAAACPAAVPWSDLPVEVVAQVARCMGSTVGAVMPISSTCRSWRQAVLEDDHLLSGLSFLLRTAAPRCSSYHMLTRRGQQHPLLLERAAKLGNVSALVVRARLLDAAGSPDEAMRCWRRAAKAGHLEGQLLYGLALYRGTAGVAADAEDAHLWLSRALKQVLGSKQAPCNPGSNNNNSSSNSSSSSNNNDSSSSSSSNNTVPGSSVAGSDRPPSVATDSTKQPTGVANDSNNSIGPQVPAAPSDTVGGGPAPSREVCGLHSRVLTQAGLVLGYLSFDGEGTRSDKQEAVRYFKLASQAGCREAQQVLGWIFNTGQY